MSKPVRQPSLRLRVPCAGVSAEQLRTVAGIRSVGQEGSQWCLTIAPGAVDRGHLEAGLPPQGPFEKGSEQCSDAALALGLAGVALASGDTEWAVWAGGTAAALTLLLPARRAFEAVWFARRSGQRLRDLRRVLGALALLALGLLDPPLLFWLPLVFGMFLGIQGLLTKAQAARWRLRWKGKEVSQRVAELQPGDLVVLPVGVPCPAPCRLEEGEGRFVSNLQSTVQYGRLGQQIPLGATFENRVLVRVLEIPVALCAALAEQPQASLWLDQTLRILEAGALALGVGYLGVAAWTQTALPDPLLVVGLVWLAPLGILDQRGVFLVEETITRFWACGLRLGTAAALDAWAQVDRIIVLPCGLEADGWKLLGFAPEPDLPGWTRVRDALATGMSSDPAVQVAPGLGVSAQLGPDTWIAGTPDFVGVDPPPVSPDPHTAALVVVRNGTVVGSGSAQRMLRQGARPGVAALRATGMPLCVLGDAEAVEDLARRAGVPDPPLARPAGPPQTWRMGGDAGSPLWVASVWGQSTPEGPCVRLGPVGPGLQSDSGLLGLAPALLEARRLRLRLAGLAATAVWVAAGALAAGLCRELTAPLLVVVWLWLGTSLWVLGPDGLSGVLRTLRRTEGRS